MYSCCDYSKILVIESALGWGGGQGASTILPKTKCNSWSGNVPGFLFLLAQVCFIPKRSHLTFLSTVIQRHSFHCPLSHPYSFLPWNISCYRLGGTSVQWAGSLWSWGSGDPVNRAHAHGRRVHTANPRLHLRFVGHTQGGSPAIPELIYDQQPSEYQCWLSRPPSSTTHSELTYTHQTGRIPCLLQTKAPKEPLSGRCDHLRVKVYVSPDVSWPID